MEKRGEKIEGSVLYRSFCAFCKEPIRVCREDINKEIYCQECNPERHVGCGKPKFKGDFTYEGAQDLEDLKSRPW